MRQRQNPRNCVSAHSVRCCLMLTERETEHERLAVFGASVFMYVCEKWRKWVSGDGREDGTNAKGKAAIKAQSAHPLPPISVRGV